MFLICSGFFLLSALPLLGSDASVWLLFAAQLLLLVEQIRKGQVSGVGGFIFMSFLFFGVRPLHLLIESDYDLFENLFLITVNLKGWSTSMWWGTCGILFFAMGAEVASRKFPVIDVKSKTEVPGNLLVVSDRLAFLMIGYQIASLGIMYILSGGGRALYGSDLGAFGYDFPVPLQSGQIFALVVIFEHYLAGRQSGQMGMLLFSGVLFLLFTWLMREVSIFRGFYIAGVMIAGIALLCRLKGKVSLYWLIVPIMLLQPLFRTLGEHRFSSNDGIQEEGVLAQSFSEDGILGSYWSFYDARGDMNIFDTFVATRESQPAFRPYLLSWLYAPVHIVPRALWKSKPERGILQDVSFMNGAPYCPGIAGFFQLDGGDLWMLGSMFLLGSLVSWLDIRVLAIPQELLRCCLIAIFTVNAVFLARAYLWFYTWQMIYAIVPCVLMSKMLGTAGSRVGGRLGKNGSR